MNWSDLQEEVPVCRALRGDVLCWGRSLPSRSCPPLCIQALDLPLEGPTGQQSHQLLLNL